MRRFFLSLVQRRTSKCLGVMRMCLLVVVELHHNKLLEVSRSSRRVISKERHHTTRQEGRKEGTYRMRYQYHSSRYSRDKLSGVWYVQCGRQTCALVTLLVRAKKRCMVYCWACGRVLSPGRSPPTMRTQGRARQGKAFQVATRGIA